MDSVRGKSGFTISWCDSARLDLLTSKWLNFIISVRLKDRGHTILISHPPEKLLVFHHMNIFLNYNFYLIYFHDSSEASAVLSSVREVRGSKVTASTQQMEQIPP